ncbi:hypothetical protein [uncultured Marinobacter sp.]|uniref:hypothetical protein n=1 Tax=uncultured Marinobacter sp. TaxID=187379 RepID=UPI002599B2A5|nr:hypothetical protein [uncultured Marinobacter sp.]
MSNSLDMLDQAIARFAPVAKEAQVAEAAERKKQELARRQAANDAQPWQQYDTFKAYRENGGATTPEAVKHFQDRQFQDMAANYSAAEQERAARESTALADDLELGSLWGEAKQNAAAAYEGGSAALGRLGAMPFTEQGRRSLEQTDDRARDIYSRDLMYRKQKEQIQEQKRRLSVADLMGRIDKDTRDTQLKALDQQEQALVPITEDEAAYLDTPVSNRDMATHTPGSRVDGKTSRELLDSALENLEKGQEVSDAVKVEGKLNPLTRDELIKDVKASWERNKAGLDTATELWDSGDTVGALKTGALAVGKLLVDGGLDLSENKLAVLQYLSENVPELAGGAMFKPLLAATNLSYASEVYRNGVADFKEREGRLPTQDENTLMTAVALASGSADYVMDTSLIRGFGNKGLEAAEAAIVQAAERSIARKAMGVATGTAGKGAGEGVTEGLQSGAESGWASLDEADGEEVFTGAVIGTGVGTGIGAAGEVAETRAKTKQAKAIQAKKDDEVQREANRSVADMIRDGEMDRLLDPDETPDIDVEALSNSVLTLARNTQGGVAPEFQQQAREALDRLDERLDFEIQALDQFTENMSPQTLRKNEEELKNIEGQIKERELSDNLEGIEPLRTRAAELRKEMATAKKDSRQDKKDREALRRSLVQYREEVRQESQQSSVEATQDAGASDVVSQATDETADVEARSQAASQAVTYAMENPDILDAPTAASLAEDTSLDLSQEQRTYLRKLAERKQVDDEAKDFDQVSLDILSTNPSQGFRSLPQYRQAIQRAVVTGNQRNANRLLSDLERFSNSHNEKAAVAEEAQRQAIESGRQVQMIATKDAEGNLGWEINTGQRLDDKALKENGGLNFNAKPGKMTDTLAKMKMEARMLGAALEELQAAQAVGTAPRPAANDAAPVDDLDALADNAAAIEQEIEQEPVYAEEANQSTTEAQPEAEPETEAATPEPVTEPEAETGSTNDPVARDGDQGDTNTGRDTQATTEERTNDSGEPDTVLAKGDGINAPESVLDIDARRNAREDEVSGTLGKDAIESENLAEAYFTTRKGLPLTANKDYVSNLLVPNKYSPEALGVTLSEDPEIREKQREAIAYFAELAPKWIEHINGLTKRKKGYQHRNMLNYFMDEDGKMEENVRTAVAVGMFTWLSENGSELWYNDEDAIRSILGLEDGETVPPDARDDLWDAGTRDKLVMNDIGQRVVQALGQKLNKSAPQNHEGQLAGAFGALGLGALRDLGYVQVIGVQAEYLAPIPKGKKTAPITYFVRSNRVETPMGWEDNPQVTSFENKVKGTQAVVHKLFDVEQIKKDPVFEEPQDSDVPKKTRRTNQDTPKEQRETLAEAQKQKHYLRQDMLDPERGILNKMSRRLLEKVQGIQELDPNTTQKNLLKTLEGRNDGLRRHIDTMFDFVQSMGQDKTKPFYFKRFVARQQRVHLDSSTFNPQEKKLHRIAMQMDGWEMEVPKDLSGLQGMMFKVSVVEAFGGKIDQQRLEDTVAAYDELVAREDIQEALGILKLLDNGVILEPEQEDALAAVLDEDSWSFDALWHLYQKDLGEGDTFISRLHSEGDGKTNGPMLSLGQLGGLVAEWGAKGGFFTAEQAHEFIGDWAAKGGQDLYQTLSWDLSDTLIRAGESSEDTRKFTELMFRMFGNFRNEDGTSVSSKGRNAVKNLLTKLMFGAGEKGSIATMGEQLVDKVYDQLDAALKKPMNEQNREDIKALFKEINRFLPNAQKIKQFKLTTANVRDFTFTPKQRKALVAAFEYHVGTHLGTVLEKQYKDFIDDRKALNSAAGLTFGLYKLVRDHEERKYLAELEAQGLLARDPDGNYLQTLSREQQQEIQKRVQDIQPILHTAMSKGGRKSAGIRMAKTKQVHSDEKLWRNTGEVGMARPIPLAPGDLNASLVPESKFHKVNQLTSWKYRIGESEEVDPGVASVIMAIHAMDSAIISRVYKTFNILNVHDAAIGSPEQLMEVASRMNQETVRALIEYSLPEEIMQSLFETLDGFEARLGELNQDPEFRKAYQALTKKYRFSDLRTHVGGLLDKAQQMDSRAMDWMETVSVVNQYGYPGGHYEVTTEDREKIVARRETPIAERIRQRQARRKARQPGLAADALRRYSETAEARLKALIDQGKPITEDNKKFVRDLRLLNQVYVTTGSLDEALGRVYKGQENKAERDNMREILFRYLAGRQAGHRDVRYAPPARIQNLIDVAQDNKYIEQDLKDDLAATGRLVAEQQKQTGTHGPLNQQDMLMTAAREATQDERGARRVVDFLNRAYNGRLETPWGTITHSEKTLSPENQVLVNAFQNQPEMTVNELLGHMRKAMATIPKNDRRRQLLGPVLAEVKKHVDLDLKVKMVTAETPISLAPKLRNPHNVKGLFRREADGASTIYVKGPDFVESDLNLELLAHEMLHSVLQSTIDGELAAKKADKKHNNPAVSPYVSELAALLKQAREYVDASPALKTKYGEAVSNINELVSWGMTNLEFQQDVLARIEMKSRNLKRKPVKGMQAFIDAIVGLFRGSRNGIELLVANTSGLLAASKAEQAKAMESTLTQSAPDPVQETDRMTTEEVFRALKGTDSRGHLANLLDSVVTSVHGPHGGVYAMVDRKAGRTPEDVFLNALASGRAPFVSKVQAQNVKLSQKEAFVLEQVEVTIQGILDTSTLAYRDLARLFKQARDQVKPEDLIAGDGALVSDTERRAAEQLHKFLFTLEPGSGESRSDHISRFAAMALVYPPLQKALNYNGNADTTAATDKLGDQIQSWFTAGTQALTNVFSGTVSNQDAQERLERLVTKLVDIESARKGRLANERIGVIDQIENAQREAGGTVRETVAKVAESSMVQNSSVATIRAAGKVTSMAAQDKLDTLFDNMENFRNRHGAKRQNLMLGIASEVRGAIPATQKLFDLMDHFSVIQNERKTRKDTTAKQVRDMLPDATEAEREALTKGILKTDLVALAETYTQEQITDMVRDNAALQRAIEETEASLAQVSGKHQAYYVNQAMATGHFMATGRTSRNLMMNVHNIAHKVGMPDAHQVPDNIVEPSKAILDRLVTLYALKDTDGDTRRITARVMTEMPEGVKFVMGMAQKYKDQSMVELFDNDPHLFAKGYIKEIYSPYVDVKAATRAEGIALEKAGYARGEMVPADPAAPDQTTRHIYVRKDGGLPPWISGALSMSGMRRKGSAIHGGMSDLLPEEVNQSLAIKTQNTTNRMAKSLLDLEKPGFNRNLANREDVALAPVVNRKGEIVNYRYLMTEANKDAFLERDTRVDSVLGAMGSAIYDKPASAEHNRNVIEALKETYDMDYRDNPSRYLEFGPDSPDKRIRETYQMLPEATKQAIRDVWGRNGLKVRNDVLDLVFGYRQYSLSEAWQSAEQGFMEELTFGVLEFFFKDKTALRGMQIGRVWDMLVNEIKDIVVIKNLFTFLGNVRSNLSILLWYGVNPIKGARDHAVAIDGLLRYQRDRRELLRLENLRDSQTYSGTLDQLNQDILELQHALATNPVTELVDAGQFQTIMEDIDTEDDGFSYKSRIAEWVDGKAQNLPSGLVTAGKYMYMSQDTLLYKALFKSTQMSDFVARYTLYQHLLTRKNNPMSKEDALREIRDAFVVYDVPSHRALDYMNRKGLVFFTKYYLRIQRVLWRLMRDHPVRGLMTAFGFSYLLDAPTVMESSALGRIGNNPLDVGAFGYPGVLDELLTMQMATSPFR